MMLQLECIYSGFLFDLTNYLSCSKLCVNQVSLNPSGMDFLLTWHFKNQVTVKS